MVCCFLAIDEAMNISMIQTASYWGREAVASSSQPGQKNVAQLDTTDSRIQGGVPGLATRAWEMFLAAARLSGCR